MNLFKPLALLLSCLTLHLSPYAQRNDLDGYYIDLQGDTISGKFISYVDYATNPSKVQFQHASDPAIALTPAICLKFSVRNSDTYISYTGKRMLNGTHLQDADADADTADKFENIVVFLRELFNDGHYRLYELHDRKRDNFYISDGAGPLTELYFKEYGIGDIVTSSVVFKRQLSAMFANSLLKDPRRANYIETMRFDAKDLLAALELLTGQKATKNKSKIPAQIFIGAGASFNSLNVTGDPSLSDYEVGSYSSQTTPIFEVGIKVYSQRNRGRFFLMGKVSYTQFQHVDSFDYGPYTNKGKTTYHASDLSIPLSIGYQIVSGKVICIEPSIGASAVFLQNNYQIHDVTGGNPYKIPNSKSFIFAPFAELAFTLLKRVSLVAGYNFPYDIGYFGSYSPNHSAFTCGVRYFIR
jgi:hypothetical protein